MMIAMVAVARRMRVVVKFIVVFEIVDLVAMMTTMMMFGRSSSEPSTVVVVVVVVANDDDYDYDVDG